jgi:cytochrome c oxidase subunit 2
MERFLGLPEIASEHGARIDQVIGLVHLLMFALFIIWGTLFVYILFRFRQSRNPKASYKGLQSHLSSYGEVGVALIEAVLLIGFAIPLYSERVDDLPEEGEGVVVRVVAEQFAWNVHYPGPDGVFGPTRVDLVDSQSNPVGLDRSDPTSKDDVVAVNQLRLPVNVPVLVRLTSKDVIHNFSIPEMRVKQDAIPGMEFPVWFVPIVTNAEMRERKKKPDFTYEISCSQLCGNGHARMRGIVTIQTQEEFDAWMAEEQEYLSEDEGGDDFWG